MIFARSLRLALLLVMVTALLGWAEGVPGKPPPGRPFALMVGDPAPLLQVARWLRGPALARYERGHIYVVDFWASWCRPCVASLPALNRLQRQYQDRVTFVWMSVWEPRPAEVERFLAGLTEKPGFAVGLDRVAVPPGRDVAVAMYDGGTATAWLKASGMDSGGLPVTFVVGADGRLAWIGGPEELATPLARIVEGRWDLRAETERHAKKMVDVARSAPLERELLASMQAQDWRRVVAVSDELLALDREKFADRAAGKFEVLLMQLHAPREAYEWGRQVLAKETHPRVLARIAWAIVDPERHVVSPDLELARRAADRAATLSPREDPAILKTQARVAFLRGDRRAALDYQRRAVAAAPPDQQVELRKELAEYGQ